MISTYVYEDDLTLRRKRSRAVASKIYQGRRMLSYTAAALKQMACHRKRSGFGHLPVCIAKTQYSFSDDPKLLGAPENFRITVREVKLCSGAGFVVVKTGDIMTMPGLPKVPAAEKIDVDEDGKITGLF